jgi:hypothetical protein
MTDPYQPWRPEMDTTERLLLIGMLTPKERLYAEACKRARDELWRRRFLLSKPAPKADDTDHAK